MHLRTRLQQLLTEMQRYRPAVAHTEDKNAPRLPQRGDHLAEPLRIKLIHPLRQVRHLLLVVARQQRVALRRFAAVRQRHAALPQDAQLVAHILIFLVAEPPEQATDGRLGDAAQARQLGAVIADQIVEMVDDKIGDALLLRRKLPVMLPEPFIKLCHNPPRNFCFSQNIA